jgi:hypothetical protein
VRQPLPHKVQGLQGRGRPTLIRLTAGLHRSARRSMNSFAAAALGIMLGFPALARALIMEAERLNAISNKLTDLKAREQELRRYL